ncbi:MAG: hypothetical protein ACREAX_00110 [Candidatus Nitrosotenuis sp.]
MDVHEEYLKGVLQQIDDSHTVISNLKDKPGDLEIIKRDLAKISGLLQALSKKVESNKDLSEYQYLQSPIRFFLENHDFFREIDIMSPLYSEDPMRLKNMRLTILDALDEKNLMGHIKAVLMEKS